MFVFAKGFWSTHGRCKCTCEGIPVCSGRDRIKSRGLGLCETVLGGPGGSSKMLRPPAGGLVLDPWALILRLAVGAIYPCVLPLPFVVLEASWAPHWNFDAGQRVELNCFGCQSRRDGRSEHGTADHNIGHCSSLLWNNAPTRRRNTTDRGCRQHPSGQESGADDGAT